MSRKIADLMIKFSGDTYEITRTTANLKKDLQGISTSCASVGKSMSLYLTAPLTAMSVISVKNAAAQEQADAKLLKALKGRVDVQKRLIAQAAELQSKSTLEDDAIIQQQAFLATLGLTEKQIKRCTEAAMETSYALEDQGVTLEMAAKSISAMYSGSTGRIGMLVPELKNLTTEELKAGKGVEMLLSKYKGTAEYLAGQGLNPLIQMKNILGDMSEDFGKVLLPLVQSASKWLKELLVTIQSLTPDTKKWIVVIGGLATAIGPILSGFGKILGIIPTLKTLFLTLISPTGLVTAAILGLAAALGYLFFQKQVFENGMVAESVQRYSSKDYSIDDLKKIREKKLDENTAANADFKYNKEQLNPLTTDSSVPEYFGLWTDRKQNKETARAEVATSYYDIQALDQLIRAKEEEQKLAEKMESIAGNITTINKDQLDLSKVQNKESQISVGLIGKMEDEMGELQKLRDAADSANEIGYYNIQIDKLQSEIERLREARNKSIIDPSSNPLNTSALTNPQYKPLQYDPNVLAHTRIGLGLDGAAEGMTQGRERLMKEAELTKNLMADMASAIQSSISNMVISFAEGIGNMFNGDGIESLGDGILKSVGNLLKTLGAMLVAYGIQMKLLKEGLKMAWLSAPVAIAIGAAMVAVGAAMSSAINKKAEQGVALAEGGLAFGPTMALVGDNRGAGSDPEVIAPLSKLRQYGFGGGSILQIAGGEFVVRGSDLILSLNRENARVVRING